MFIETLISTIFQLVLFSAVPFLWWLISVRGKESFFSWIGLRKPKFKNPQKVYSLTFLSLILLFAPGLILTLSIEDKTVLAGTKFIGSGFEGAAAILLYACIQTGLSEEVLFRGFLLKRISNKLGFIIGNITQAVLFGLVHGVLLFNAASITIVILLVVFTAGVGWLMGYLNEKMADGSIVLSWCIHSLTNILTALLFLFGIITIPI